jgi:hypothetical protein
MKMIASPTDFKDENEWFDTNSRDRVWAADITGNGRADSVGVAGDGTIFTILNQGAGEFSSVITSGFAFPTDQNWFSTGHKQRVWPTDINGDGKTDLVGIAGTGEIYYALSNGNGTFSNMQIASGGYFATDQGWFSTDTRDRVWPADITGNGRADFVGVAGDGTIYTILNQGAGKFSSVITSGFAFPTDQNWFSTGHKQ